MGLLWFGVVLVWGCFGLGLFWFGVVLVWGCFGGVVSVGLFWFGVVSYCSQWSPLVTSSPWTRPPKVQSNVLLSMLRSPWLPEYQKVCQSTLKSIRCPTKSLSHSSKFYQKCLKDSKSLWRFLQGRSPSPNYLVQKFLKAPQNTSDVPNSSLNSNRFPQSPLHDHQILKR